MNRIGYFFAAATAVIYLCAGQTPALAQYAAEVVSYTAGATPSPLLITSSAALGSPERFTGEGGFPSVVSPFSPPYLSSEIVSIGQGGQITLRLSNYAVAQGAGSPELGIFTNAGIADNNYPLGQAGSPPFGFGINSAVVEVSPDSVSWYSFGSVLFDVPTNGYTDLSDPFSTAPGNAPSDFQQPFVGSLSSFDGLAYDPAIRNLLNGSGGGKWLDISSSGFAQVGFVRFSVADVGNPALNFVLDAVSVSHDALGAAVPEPAMAALLIAAIIPAMARRRRPQEALSPELAGSAQATAK
jgi:hypothetical protein